MDTGSSSEISPRSGQIMVKILDDFTNILNRIQIHLDFDKTCANELENSIVLKTTYEVSKIEFLERFYIVSTFFQDYVEFCL